MPFIPGRDDNQDLFNLIMETFEDPDHARHARIVAEGLQGPVSEATGGAESSATVVKQMVKIGYEKTGSKPGQTYLRMDVVYQAKGQKAVNGFIQWLKQNGYKVVNPQRENYKAFNGEVLVSFDRGFEQNAHTREFQVSATVIDKRYQHFNYMLKQTPWKGQAEETTRDLDALLETLR